MVQAVMVVLFIIFFAMWVSIVLALKWYIFDIKAFLIKVILLGIGFSLLLTGLSLKFWIVPVIIIAILGVVLFFVAKGWVKILPIIISGILITLISIAGITFNKQQEEETGETSSYTEDYTTYDGLTNSDIESSSEYNDTYYIETDTSVSQDNIYEDEPQQTDDALNTLQEEENQSKAPSADESEDSPIPSLPFDINGTYHLEKLSRLYTAEVSGVPDNPYIHVTGKEQDGTIIIDYSGPLEILFSAVDNEKIPSKTIQETEEGSRKLNCYFYNNRLSISDSKHNNNDQVHSFNGYYDK